MKPPQPKTSFPVVGSSASEPSTSPKADTVSGGHIHTGTQEKRGNHVTTDEKNLRTNKQRQLSPLSSPSFLQPQCFVEQPVVHVQCGAPAERPAFPVVVALLASLAFAPALFFLLSIDSRTLVD